MTYYACDDANTFCIPVTQSYDVGLRVDPEAGRVFGARPRFGVAGTGPRAPRAGRGGPDAMVERIRSWDANDDGLVARGEVPEPMRDRFDRMDENGDGVLESDEIESLPARMGPGPGRGARGRASDPVAGLRSFDADGDGKITRAEIPERAAGMFDRVDTNGDGVIVTQELDAMAERLPRRR